MIYKKTDNLDLEKKMSDTIRLVKKVDYTAKITEIEKKIPNNSCLATTSALTAVQNKMPDVSSLVKKKTITQKLLKS